MYYKKKRGRRVRGERSIPRPGQHMQEPTAYYHCSNMQQHVNNSNNIKKDTMADYNGR